MPAAADSPAPNGDVENDIRIPQNSKSVKKDFSLKDSEGAGRVQAKQNTDTNSSQNLEIKKNEQYNGSVSHSLKWHTDLNATQFKALEKEIRQIENHEPKRIADTDGCWYKGRMNGDDLFAIYSTADKNNPTILYERKGKYGKLELDILMDLLEDEENGTSINGKSSFAQRVSQGNWMPMVNSSQNNLRNLGGGGHNQNAGVLPGQSQRNGSRAFRNVLENLFRTQEENGRISEGKSYSLKDTENYSLKDDPRIQIKYSSTGIKLPKNEYAKFHQSTNTDYHKSYKTHEGLQYQSCVTDDTHILYIYEDGGFNNYNVVAKINFANEDIIKSIMEEIGNGTTYRIADIVGRVLQTFEVRRSGYTVYNARTKSRISSRGDDSIFEGASKAYARGTDEGGSRVSGDKRGLEKNRKLSEDKSYSLKEEYWHTDLNKTQFKALEKEIRQIENHEPKRIGDTDACWYKSRLDGETLFSIYSTADKNNPTILYERKGAEGKAELDVLQRVLEVIENGESTIGIQRNIDRLLGGDWVQEKHNMENNNVRLGERNGDTGNASILQGESSEFIGSKAFRNVLYDIYKKQAAIRKDSNGKVLSRTQAEYFEESKVRDENGNLLVMYQGSKEDFTVFDRKKSSHANLYGRGFYFTKSENHASQYGKTRAFYLNIKHPVSTTETTITKSQLRKFLEAVAENEDYSFENYGYEATVDGVLQSIYGKSDFLMLNDVSQTAVGDLVEAVELFNEVNGTDYDGIILDTETVTFNSEQAKLTSNENPTSNPDINYSLKGGVSATEILDTIEGVQKGQKDAKNRLYKYVKDGEVSTRLYSELIEKYGAIPKGEKPHRDIQVPERTARGKKVSQTIRTILEAEATPDAVLPTIEKMVLDGVFSYDAYTDKQAIKDADAHIKE